MYVMRCNHSQFSNINRDEPIGEFYYYQLFCGGIEYTQTFIYIRYTGHSVQY